MRGDGRARYPAANDGDIEIHRIIPMLQLRKDCMRVSLWSTKFHIRNERRRLRRRARNP
jgi:hypothetical protein